MGASLVDGFFRGTSRVAKLPHAFHAFVWRKNARDHWRDTFRFLDRTLAPAGAAMT